VYNENNQQPTTNNQLNNFILGKEYNETFIVTENVYRTFQECSKDKNPLHTDEIFAKSKGFHSRVMYGNILNAFLSYFIGECLPTKDVMIHSQEINYKKPVYLNDTLQLEAVIDEIHESVNVILFKYKYRNQNNEIIAKGNIQIGVLV
jgi:acyl dehydratase